jgi:multicomponent Na+:H+ antiporter subunit A
MRELPAGMLLAPSLLASLLLVLSLPLVGMRTITQLLIIPAASLIAAEPASIEWSLWQRPAFTLMLTIGVLILSGGGAFYERPVMAALPKLPASLSVSRMYDMMLSGLQSIAVTLTRLLQTGNLRTYIATLLMVWLGVVGPIFVYFGLRDVAIPPLNDLAEALLDYKMLIVLLIPVGVIVATITRSRLGAMVAVSSIGAIIALFFGLLSAPGLALMQLLSMMMTSILFLLVFSVLPARFTIRSPQTTRIRDTAIAAGIGMMMAGLTFVTAENPLFESISAFYIQRDDLLAANRVNAILFNFRGFDVLGGITVLFISMLGVYGLLRLRRIRPPERSKQNTGKNGR